MRSTSILPTLFAFALSLQALTAANEAAKVTFADDVFPILDNKCVSCHNTDEAKGGLDLASFGSTLSGGSGGAVVISEDPKSSRLYTLASHSEEPVMPPKGTKATEAELKIIAAWIAGGLLETKNSKAKKADKPKVDFNSITSTGKPDGPPAMPEHLILEPSVVTERPNSIPALAHSPWAPILAVAGQKQILLYHSSDYDLMGVLPYPEGFPQTLSFSPNGAYLFCGGGRAGKSGNIVAWDIKTGERIIEAGKEYDIVLGGDISPDLKNAIMGGPGRLIKLWDTVAGEQISSTKKHTDWVLAAAYSPDGVIYATGDRNGGLYIWEAATGYEFYTLKGHTLAVTDLDWRMDGNILASSSEDGSVILWEMNGGTQVKKFDAHPGGVQGVDIAPDGTIATVGRDKNLKIWKADGTAIRAIAASEDIVLSVAVSEDSKRAFTGDLLGNIKAWDIANGTEIARIDANPPPIEQQLAYSEKRISELTGQLPKLEEGVKAASTELTAARKQLAEVDKTLAAVTKNQKASSAAVAKLDGSVKALTPAVAKLTETVTAKNATLKTVNDTLAATSAALKSQQDAAAAAATALATKEAALQAATAALVSARTEAAKPALSPEQKTQHDTLAAALSAATKARQAADEVALAKAKEQASLDGQLVEAKKLLGAAAAERTRTKAAADAATAALGVASAESKKAAAALAAATANGQTPAPEIASAAKAAADREAAARTAHAAATATFAAADDKNRKATDLVQTTEAKAKAATNELAAAQADQAAKGVVLAQAEAAFAPLRAAAAAGTEAVKKAQANLAAKTTASQQAEKARNDAKNAADKAAGLLGASKATIAELNGKLAPAKAEANAASAALAAKQKELATANTALAAARAELKKSDELIVATTKQKEAAAAKVAAVVAKEAETKKSIALAKAELQNTQFLNKKWQAAAINLTAVRESENLDDMAGKLDDMMAEETEAKKVVEDATIARTEAQSTLATAKKAVETGTLALQEKSSSVLERALKLVASRAVAELREEAIQNHAASDVVLASPPAAGPVDSETKIEIGTVATEALSYKTPAEINAEVMSLKSRLSDLKQFLADTYVEATETKSTVLAADQVARETPQVIAERAKAEEAAARELAEAEAERKRQEQALADQKKRIEELREKYLATLPKRES